MNSIIEIGTQKNDYMKNSIEFLLLIFLFGACQKSTHQDPIDLIGKTVEYQYGESVYHVSFDSDSTLHWEAIAGDEKGTKEDETYVSEWIESQKLFITWGEANGIGVSQILDFEKGQVHNHLLRGRTANSVIGEIQLLKY
jgi:hypothetical protein